jgi:serine/threonine-protein kinase
VPDSLLRIDPETNAVDQVTRIGRDPDQLAFGGNAVWVVNQRDRTVTRVRLTGEQDTIGGVPYADKVVVDGDDVWVSSFDRASVAHIDARTAELVESIGIESRHAEGLTVGGGFLWITNPATVRGQGTETVSRFDLRSREVVSTIAVGKTPIFTTFGLGSVWVSNYDDDTVSVIRPGSARAETIRVADGPLGIATGYGSVWVVCYWKRQLVRIDPATQRIVARIGIGEGPLSVATGAGGVWVTNRDSRTVSRIDPRSNRVVAEVRIPAPASPRGVVTGGDAVWVSVYRCPHAPCF